MFLSLIVYFFILFVFCIIFWLNIVFLELWYAINKLVLSSEKRAPYYFPLSETDVSTNFVLCFYLFMYPEWLRLLMPLDCPFLSTIWLYCFQNFDLFNFSTFRFWTTWWRLFQKCVVRTKFDIYGFSFSLTSVIQNNPNTVSYDWNNLSIENRKRIKIRIMVFIATFNWNS